MRAAWYLWASVSSHAKAGTCFFVDVFFFVLFFYIFSELFHLDVSLEGSLCIIKIISRFLLTCIVFLFSQDRRGAEGQGGEEGRGEQEEAGGR